MDKINILVKEIALISMELKAVQDRLDVLEKPTDWSECIKLLEDSLKKMKEKNNG